MADGIVYTHDEFIGLLMDTIDRQLTVSSTATIGLYSTLVSNCLNKLANFAAT